MSRLLKVLLGPFLCFFWFQAPFTETLTTDMQLVGATTILMACWWLLEALPLPVTALVPLLIFPLSGLSSLSHVADSYSHPVLVLFLGGCLLALGLERWGLHTRIAVLCLSWLGGGTKRVVFSFLCVSAGLSFWMSNTATTMMMIPIVLSTVDLQGGTGRWKSLEVCLLLAVAYGATIGGMGTLMGTPPNSLLAGFLQQRYGVDVTFFDWLLIGLSFIVGLLPMAWLLIVVVLQPPCLSLEEVDEKQEHFARLKQQLPGWSAEECWLLGLYMMTICAWVFRPWLSLFLFDDDRLTDSAIALFAGCCMFVLPLGVTSEPLLKWENTQKLPWGIFLLFGGGLALSKAVEESGLAKFILENFGLLGGHQPFQVFMAVTALVLLMTELTSNIATTAAFLPILSDFGEAGSLPLGLLVGMTLSASCAFMLPVATAPNALVFATGRLKMSDMLKVGMLLNFVAWCWLLCLGRWVWPFLLPVVSRVPVGVL